jgi:hypothetical protein
LEARFDVFFVEAVEVLIVPHPLPLSYARRGEYFFGMTWGNFPFVEFLFGQRIVEDVVVDETA